MNETIFIAHTIFISLAVIFCSRFGKESLVALSAIMWLLANLFVIKQIDLFGFSATSSDAFVIGGSLATGIITEKWGDDFAKKSVYICFGILVFFAILSFVHVKYNPSAFDTSQPHFKALLEFVPRIVFASFIAFIVSQLFNVALTSFLKRKFNGRFLTLRIVGAIILSQLIDTALFGIVGLFGIVSSLLSIMAISFTLKVIAVFLTTPLISFIKKY
jgi:uncharacterized integral membrane protein (TIGR00697 family)